MLEFILLGFLSEQEMSGYDIKQHMTHSTANFFNASFGSIYPTLKKLEDKKMIVSREVIDGGKYKKLYCISNEGRKVFLEWLRQPIELSRHGHDHLVKIFFFKALTSDEACNLISGLIDSIQETLEGLDRIESLVKDQADYFKMATLYFGKDHYRFVIEWCQKFLQEIPKNK